LKNHKTVIVLEADTETIEQKREKLYNVGINSEIFRDDDLDDMLTAVAFEPMDAELGKKMLSSLKLA
jgi:hypothetical protein